MRRKLRIGKRNSKTIEFVTMIAFVAIAVVDAIELLIGV